MSEDDLFEERSGDVGNGEIFTRYSREERLKNAPPEVQQLHDSDFIPKRGLIRSLTATKGLKFVFFVIVLLAVLNLGFFLLHGDKDSGSLHKVKVELSTFVFEGTPLANLKMDANKDFQKKLKAGQNSEGKKDSSSDGNVEAVGDVVKVQFSFFDKDKNKLFHTIKTAIYNGTELTLSARDETKKAKSVQVNILMKEKLLTLTKKIND